MLCITDKLSQYQYTDSDFRVELQIYLSFELYHELITSFTFQILWCIFYVMLKNLFWILQTLFGVTGDHITNTPMILSIMVLIEVDFCTFVLQFSLFQIDQVFITKRLHMYIRTFNSCDKEYTKITPTAKYQHLILISLRVWSNKVLCIYSI